MANRGKKNRLDRVVAREKLRRMSFFQSKNKLVAVDLSGERLVVLFEKVGFFRFFPSILWFFHQNMDSEEKINSAPCSAEDTASDGMVFV